MDNLITMNDEKSELKFKPMMKCHIARAIPSGSNLPYTAERK